jgi:hypothetical protein
MKKFITIAQFALMLSEINISTFAQALSQTEPKLNKKSRVTGEPLPFNKVLNCRNINLQLNYDYEAQVIRRDEKQNAGEPSNFEAQEHTWARKVKGALARHKDYAIDMLNIDFNSLDTTKLYMPYVKLRIDSQMYIADGKPIDKEALINFMPPASNYDNQPAEKKVVVEYMKLASIKEFTLSGVDYQII